MSLCNSCKEKKSINGKVYCGIQIKPLNSGISYEAGLYILGSIIIMIVFFSLLNLICT